MSEMKEKDYLHAHFKCWKIKSAWAVKLTAHVVVSPTWSSASTSSSEAWVSSSPPAPVEVSSPVWASSHGVVAPVVAIVRPAALWTGRRTHHAWATGVKRWSMAVGRRRRRMVKMWSRGLVWRETPIHGHRHVVHVVHVHAGAMAKQTRVHYEVRETQH